MLSGHALTRWNEEAHVNAQFDKLMEEAYGAAEDLLVTYEHEAASWLVRERPEDLYDPIRSGRPDEETLYARAEETVREGFGSWPYSVLVKFGEEVDAALGEVEEEREEERVERAMDLYEEALALMEEAHVALIGTELHDEVKAAERIVQSLREGLQFAGRLDGPYTEGC